MPLKAVCKETNEVVYSFDFEDKLSLISKYPNLKCPLTNIDVYVRSRAEYVLHFVRKTKANIVMEHHPESVEHYLSKIEVIKSLRQEIELDTRLTGYKVEAEFPLPNIGKHGRIADVAVLSPYNQPVYICECQLSSITEEQLQQRTEDYESAGIDCIWILGKSANSDKNRKWLYSKFGVAYSLSFSEEEILSIRFLSKN